MNLIDSLTYLIEIASRRKMNLEEEIKGLDQYKALVNKEEMVEICQREIDAITESAFCIVDFLQDLRRLERSKNNAIESSKKIANVIGIISEED